MTIRRSDIVYVLARLQSGGRDYFLFRAHSKWGDWGLVGGHVEEWEVENWDLAARRETEEEMSPLRVGTDLVLDPIPGPAEWGPEPSRSAGGQPTVYRAQWYALRFLVDPRTALRRLDPSEFLFVEHERLSSQRDEDVTDLVRRVAAALPRGLDDVPLAWNADVNLSELLTRRSPTTEGSPSVQSKAV